MSQPLSSARLLPAGFRVVHLGSDPEGLTLLAEPGVGAARCPLCGSRSERVPSRYSRTVSDLPWRGIAVTLEVRARKFFCDSPACRRRVFCERLPDVAAHARKTGRLEEALSAIAFALGGEAGARLAWELGLLVGPDALLRRVRAAPSPDAGVVRVLGVDDFAFRKGNRYGTILVDLERRKLIDLLPERSTGSLAGWLREHPGVEVAARDRSHVYARGIAEGAPGATQVADRWHLLHNLALALEEFLLHKRPALKKAAMPEETSEGAEAALEGEEGAEASTPVR